MQVLHPFVGSIRNSSDRVARTSMTQAHQVDTPGKAREITESGSRQASDCLGYVDQWVAFSERMSLWKGMNSFRDVRRIRRYVIWVGLGLAGLVIVVGLLVATSVTAY